MEYNYPHQQNLIMLESGGAYYKCELYPQLAVKSSAVYYNHLYIVCKILSYITG